MSFASDWDRIEAKTLRKMDTAVRKVGAEALRRVVMRSPVDTGRFKGNWQVSVNSVPSGDLTTTDPTGSMTISAGSDKALRASAGDSIYIVNNLPYARRIEYGWSQQAPQGMVRITARELEPVVKQIVRELSRE